MTVQIPAGYAQIVLRYTVENFDTGSAATVLGFGSTGVPLTDADVFAGEVRDAWAANLQNLSHEYVTLDSVYWATTTQSGEIAANLTGTRTGAITVPNTATLVSYVTGFKGPRARGRSYFPGFLNDDDVDDSGNIVTVRFGQIETAMASFFTTLEAITPQVILQRVTEVQKTPPISPPPEVLTHVVRGKVASQRRRLRR